MPELLVAVVALWVFAGPIGREIREVLLGTTALEGGLAVVLAALLGVRAGWAPEVIGATALALWPLVYIGSCMAWPMRRCPNPRCSRRNPRTSGGGGVFRPRAACRVCGGQDMPRLGTRLLLGGGRDD